jgi:hypothetical protein
MVSDAQLLESCPDYVSVGSMLKAHPVEDGGRRFCYFEASKEALDQQQEVVLAKALADAAGFYGRYGNVDIDHYTQIGAKLGIPDYPTYEIGRPCEVGQRDGSTFVKSELYSAAGPDISSPMLEKATMVWDGMTKVRPPQRWYPSIGGAVLGKSIRDGVHGRHTVIDKVRWTNVGLSKTPVNQHVDVCGAMPIGTFAKALTAGYGTDAATLSGGGAMRVQSLDRGVKSYFDFRERISDALRKGDVDKTPAALAAHATNHLGLSADEGAGYVERFMSDLQSGLRRKAS